MNYRRPVNPTYIDSEQKHIASGETYIDSGQKDIVSVEKATTKKEDTVFEEETTVNQEDAASEDETVEKQEDATSEGKAVTKQEYTVDEESTIENETKTVGEQSIKNIAPSRKNDNNIGRRNPPTPHIYTHHSPQIDDEPEEEIDEPKEVACDTSFYDKLQHFLMPLFLLVIALLGCSITKNIAVFYQTVRSMSVWEIILFSIPMAFFIGILVFMLYKIISLMFHLRTFTQISGKALQELREREELRRLSIQRKSEARKKLMELIKEDSKEQEKLFSAFGEDKLSNAKVSLLNDHCTDRDWIKKFVKEYQDKVDKLAKDIVSRYSWKAATAATASPFVALDQIIVLATCVTMLKDLFILYNLRPTWDKNLLLMTRIVIHVYATGFWQDFSKAGVDALDKGIDTFIDNVKNTKMEGIMTKAGSSIGGMLGGKLGNIVARGVGECVMHKITVGRLGEAAIRMLQPVGK